MSKIKTTPSIFPYVIKGDYFETKKILEAGGNVNERSTGNITPLHVACAMKKGFNLVKLLVTHLADVNASTHKGITPLMVSLIARQNRISLFLLQFGTKHAFDRMGRGLFDYCTWYQPSSAVQSFIIDLATDDPLSLQELMEENEEQEKLRKKDLPKRKLNDTI